jgi:hypothetical protein
MRDIDTEGSEEPVYHEEAHAVEFQIRRVL